MMTLLDPIHLVDFRTFDGCSPFGHRQRVASITRLSVIAAPFYMM